MMTTFVQIKKPRFVILGHKICSKNKLNRYRPEVCPEIEKKITFIGLIAFSTFFLILFQVFYLLQAT